jgi:hypothetical protein
MQKRLAAIVINQKISRRSLPAIPTCGRQKRFWDFHKIAFCATQMSIVDKWALHVNAVTILLRGNRPQNFRMTERNFCSRASIKLSHAPNAIRKNRREKKLVTNRLQLSCSIRIYGLRIAFRVIKTPIAVDLATTAKNVIRRKVGKKFQPAHSIMI